MRWYILKALLVKEWQRHLANRGGIALALLLVAAAVLLSVFAPGGESSVAGTEAVGGIRHCFVEFDHDTDLVKHLRKNMPPELREQIQFRELAKAPQVNGLIVYPTGTASIQIRQIYPQRSPSGRYTVQVSVWHPDGDPTALAPYESWLWKELRRFYEEEARKKGIILPPEPQFDTENQWLLLEAHKRFQEQIAASQGNSQGTYAVPNLEVNRKGLGGKVLDFRSAIATALVIFALYFTCVYLLPTLNCEERERGVLLAQALSPASPLEIVTAKFLFYPTAGIILAVTIAAVYKTAILSSLFFWLALFAVGGGFLGIGMTIATLARTQKAAFLGGMCYLMSVSMLLLICSMNNIPFLQYLAVEYHGPRILHAAITGDVVWYHWYNLLGAAALAVAWLTAAGWLFRRRGWQ
ncbi:MAG TPA: ABC transporter permease [Gemmata sp.]|nr:ABC transporter permease [Gemmata sp.]